MGEYDGLAFPADAQVNQEEWDQFVDFVARRHVTAAKWVFTHLPSTPRCAACGSPFGGLGGRLMKFAGREPSRMNPNWCAGCFEKAPPGGFVGTVGVLFADVRGSTALGERLAPKDLADRYNEFYDVSTRAIVRHGIVDKLIGDEVMGLYLPALCGGRIADALVDDAAAILRSLGRHDEPTLAVGIGIGIGEAYVGHVGSDHVSDFTAIGDIVNTVARLQSHAGAGEIVMPTAVAELAGATGRNEVVSVKGKEQPLSVCVMTA